MREWRAVRRGGPREEPLNKELVAPCGLLKNREKEGHKIVRRGKRDQVADFAKHLEKSVTD